MKRLVQISAVIFSILFIVGIASAATYSYGDIYNEWPGHATSNAGVDVIGNGPWVDSAVVVADAGYLKSASFKVGYADGGTNWRLFINADWAGGNYEAWDYYAVGIPNITKFYEITNGYAYTYPVGSSRTGHPNGMETAGLSQLLGILTVTWDSVNGELIYTFGGKGLYIGDAFVIGFTSDCANDVFLTPVPEPATMLLLGLGLVGAAAIRRRMK